MKKFFLTIMVAALQMITLRAQESHNDTLLIETPDKVVIAQNADTLTIQVAGQKNNPNYRYEREVVLANDAESRTTQTQSKNSALSWDFGEIEDDKHTTSLELKFFNNASVGFLFPIHKPSGMGSCNWKSFEASINMMSWILRPGNSNNYYMLDFKMDFRHLEMTGNTRFEAIDNHLLSISPYPDGAQPVHSMYDYMNPTISLSMYHRFNRDFTLGVGIGNTIHGRDQLSYCRSTYNDANGIRQTETGRINRFRTSNFNFRLDALLLGYTGLYVKYEPWSFFHKGEGPDFGTISTGILFQF